MKSFSAKSLGLLCAAALLLTASVADAAVPKKRNPVTDSRRTLFATVGQTTMVFEAPKGMCFLDESRMTENVVLKSLQETTRQMGGLLIAVFADCKEVAGMGVVESGDSFRLNNRGSIVWADAKKPVPKKMTREEYIAMYAPNFREEAFNDMLRAFSKHGRLKKRVEGSMMTATYMANPEDYEFDAKPRVTEDGVTLAYGVDTEIDYKKLTTSGVMGKTLIRHLPLEFQMSTTGGRKAHDFATDYKKMESFIAQQVRLNR